MKKKMSFFVIVAVLVITGTGCNLDNEVTKYTVTFNASGGIVSPLNVEVEDGNNVNPLPIPVKDSTPNVFWGWWTSDGNPNLGFAFTSITTVNKDITVYARWVAVSDNDIFAGTWHSDDGYTIYVAANGIWKQTITLGGRSVISDGSYICSGNELIIKLNKSDVSTVIIGQELAVTISGDTFKQGNVTFTKQ
jgi:hypothetical protein